MWKGKVKYPLFLSDFNETWIFSTDFRKLNLIDIHPVGVELFHAGRQTDGQTGMTNLIVAIRNFCERTYESKDIPVQALVGRGGCRK